MSGAVSGGVMPSSRPGSVSAIAAASARSACAVQENGPSSGAASRPVSSASADEPLQRARVEPVAQRGERDVLGRQVLVGGRVHVLWREQRVRRGGLMAGVEDASRARAHAPRRSRRGWRRPRRRPGSRPRPRAPARRPRRRASSVPGSVKSPARTRTPRSARAAALPTSRTLTPTDSAGTRSSRRSTIWEPRRPVAPVTMIMSFPPTVTNDTPMTLAVEYRR